jgi:hypothetical protein
MASERRYQEMNDLRVAYENITTPYCPPTQIEYVFQNEILAFQTAAHESGKLISIEEAEQVLETSLERLMGNRRSTPSEHCV